MIHRHTNFPTHRIVDRHPTRLPATNRPGNRGQTTVKSIVNQFGQYQSIHRHTNSPTHRIVDRHSTHHSATNHPERRSRARVLINHDDALRLIGRDQSNGEKIRHTLDNAGRITQTQTFDAQNTLSTTSSSSVYDGLNRVLQQINASGKITNYTYDANGNVTTVVDPNNLTTSTQYDALNRPILVTDPNLKTVATSYTPDDKVAAVIREK